MTDNFNGPLMSAAKDTQTQWRIKKVREQRDDAVQLTVDNMVTIVAKDARIKALREALEEIRDVARVSDGVEWYAMIANEALTKDDAP